MKASPQTKDVIATVLPTAHAGALSAQLRQQKKVKLRVNKRVGKAYSEEQKKALIVNAKSATRSKAIHLATMLALHAGMRDKEIRTLQWTRFDLHTRTITVSESETDAGMGRTIPMNQDLFSAALEYVQTLHGLKRLFRRRGAMCAKKQTSWGGSTTRGTPG